MSISGGGPYTVFHENGMSHLPPSSPKQIQWHKDHKLL